MEYLYKVLGIKATVQRAEFDHLPNYIAVRYRLQKVSMDGQKVIFLYPKTELEQIEVLKKHIARIQKKENLPVVLVLNELSYRQKEYLLREKIPFIVDGKQIYLPFMSVYLQERCDAEKQPREDLLPSAQLLLLHFIYGGTKELPSSQAAKDLKLTATSISRASRQLEEMGLLQIKKADVQKILLSEDPPEVLFQKAEETLLNPVKRTVYVPKEYIGADMLVSGYSALAEYSMLSAPAVECYATDKISQWKNVMTNRLQDSKTQVAVEMWRYDPRILATGHSVVTLCGSTRFKEQFMDAQKRLTLAGYIVISVGLFGHAGDQEVWDGMDEGTLSKTKEMLDDMHKRKIDMADEIYVINVGGYIGDSTRSEIQYAEEHGKPVRYYQNIRK